VLPCIKLFRDVMRKSLLLPCMEELDLLKKNVLQEGDVMKLVDSKGKIHLTVMASIKGLDGSHQIVAQIHEGTMHVKFDLKVPTE
ncbi:hypothetical protein Pmar_PMAR024950, partial [Perkinsus marinus ATCC 50983]